MEMLLAKMILRRHIHRNIHVSFNNSGCHSKVIMRECNHEEMEFLQKRIQSCASLFVSCVTPFITFLENFRSQLTLYLLLIGTFNHGRVIFHLLDMQPWGDHSFQSSLGCGLFPQNAYAWKPGGPAKSIPSRLHSLEKALL